MRLVLPAPFAPEMTTSEPSGWISATSMRFTLDAISFSTFSGVSGMRESPLLAIGQAFQLRARRALLKVPLRQLRIRGERRLHGVGSAFRRPMPLSRHLVAGVVGSATVRALHEHDHTRYYHAGQYYFLQSTFDRRSALLSMVHGTNQGRRCASTMAAETAASAFDAGWARGSAGCFTSGAFPARERCVDSKPPSRGTHRGIHVAGREDGRLGPVSGRRSHREQKGRKIKWSTLYRVFVSV